MANANDRSGEAAAQQQIYRRTAAMGRKRQRWDLYRRSQIDPKQSFTALLAYLRLGVQADAAALFLGGLVRPESGRGSQMHVYGCPCGHTDFRSSTFVF